MGILNDLDKHIWYSAAGRIHYYSNMWALVNSRWDKKRIQNKNLIKRVNEKGEADWEKDGLVIVKRQCTTNCPNSPIDDVYINDKGKAWVPATECRKCPFHIPATRGSGFNFPRCTFGRDSGRDGVAKAALNTFTDIVKQATDKVDEVMK